MYIGADYYPEHWERERWAIDAKMMKEAGFNVVRMAEFAWIKMEPTEGEYEFTWLDEAIETLGREGVKVILGTPTGSMPAWVALKYPEVVVTERNGNKTPYGNRKDNCPTSKSYRALGGKITEAMAKHYAHHDNVIGWQTDNELGGPNCYCNTCKVAFQEWLTKKYITIENLNEKLGTIFWSHTYRSFNEVPLPRREFSNPSMELDYCRFHSEQVVSFQKEQIDIIRKLCPDKFITHNLMGFYDNINYYDLAKDIDFVSWDYYYSGGSYKNRFSDYVTGAAAHDLMRSLKKKNFWIMENSAGPLGWDAYSRNLRPGEFRHMTLQNVAHGAEGQVWFRWRTCRYGTEQYWHGILGHDGIAGRRYKEAKEVANILHKVSPLIEGAEIISEVAIVLSYEDRWAFRLQKNSPSFDYVNHLMKYYKALSKQGVNVDFVEPNEDISTYKLVILPTNYIMTEEFGDKITSFVDQGGVIITTFRTGVKDIYNVPYVMILPGYLRKVTGVRVEEYESISEDYKYKVSLEGSSYEAEVLADWVTLEGAQSLGIYEEKDLENFAAITVNSYGNGKAYYVGTSFTEKEPYNKIIAAALKDGNIKTFGLLPEGVEIVQRTKAEKTYMFVINHTDETVNMNLPKGKDIISGKDISQNYNIPARDVIINLCE